MGVVAQGEQANKEARDSTAGQDTRPGGSLKPGCQKLHVIADNYQLLILSAPVVPARSAGKFWAFLLGFCIPARSAPYIRTAAPLGHTPYLTGGQRVRGAAPGDFFTI